MLPTTPHASDRAGHDPRHVPVHGAGAARREEADARTDIFAFGAVLYEMLTGKKAFEGKSQASLIGAILHAEPRADVDSRSRSRRRRSIASSGNVWRRTRMIAGRPRAICWTN